MYVKIFQQILDSSIADDRRLRHFFIDLLLCSDAKGYVVMTKVAIARRISAPVEEVEWGIEELLKPDAGSKTQTANGARIEALDGLGYGWRIINYEHYRSMKDADQLREASAERVRRFRAKNKCNVTETEGNASNANTYASASVSSEKKGMQGEEGKFPATAARQARRSAVVYSDDFETFWSAYPRKEGKGAAWEAWEKIRSPLPDATKLAAAINMQKQSDKWKEERGRFIPMPSTWINQRRWDDEGILITVEKPNGC